MKFKYGVLYQVCCRNKKDIGFFGHFARVFKTGTLLKVKNNGYSHLIDRNKKEDIILFYEKDRTTELGYDSICDSGLENGNYTLKLLGISVSKYEI